MTRRHANLSSDEKRKTQISQSPESSRKLPEGWRWVKLGEVCEIIAGQSPPSSTYRKTAEGLPFYQGKADFGTIHPLPRVWCVEPIRIAESGDILISVRAPVGPTNLANSRCCIGRGLAAIRAREGTDTNFVLAFLKDCEVDLARKGSGSTFQAISRSDLEILEIPLPPLSEQKRIAAILNDQMSSVERARKAAEERLAAVKALLDAEYREVFSSDQIRCWDLKTVADIATLVTDGPHVTPTYIPDGVPFVTVTNIQSGRLNFDNISYISVDDHNRFSSRAQAESGDILYSKDGTLGIPCVVDTDRPFSFFVSVALIKLKRHLVDPYFVAHIMASPYGRQQVECLSTGAGLKHMVLKSIQTLRIPCPCLLEQHRIAGMLNEKMSAVEHARKAAEEELETINALPSSLLRRAFAGEL